MSLYTLLPARFQAASHMLGRATLALWIVVMLATGTFMLAKHTIPLPGQSDSDREIAARFQPWREQLQARDAEWLMVHVLYVTCPCSGRIYDHLLERDPAPQARELVLLVGEEPEWRAKLEAKGFAVEELAPEALKARYGLQAAPLLLIIDPLQRLRYSGGYTSRKQAIAVHDVPNLIELQHDRSVAALPLYGCAVSQELRALVDPLELF